MSHLLRPGDLQALDEAQFAARFKLCGKLGSGAFADVYRVRFVDPASSPKDAALKVLRPTGSHPVSAAAAAAAIEAGEGLPVSPVADSVTPSVMLFREARALKHAQGPNVVDFHGVLHVPHACIKDGSSRSRSARHSRAHDKCWGLLQENMQGGSLTKMIYLVMSQPHVKVYSVADALTWGIDVASGIAHLHSLNPLIVHRDLKLENVMLTRPPAAAAAEEGGGRKLPVAKLADFGLHVMIDRPPVPFLITTGPDGQPMLILNPKEADKQQQQPRARRDAEPQDDSSPPDAPAGAAADSLDSQEEELLSSFSGPLMSAEPGSGSSADALAVAGAVIAKDKGAVPLSVLKGSSGTTNSSSLLHKGSSATDKHRVQFMGLASAAVPPCDDSSSTTSSVPGAPAVAAAVFAAGSDGGAQQWQRLTSRTLRRLSLDTVSSPGNSAPLPTAGVAGAAAAGAAAAAGNSGPLMIMSASPPVSIPLLLQRRRGSAFLDAAFPSAALSDAGPVPEEGGRAASSKAAGGGGDDDVGSILEAANTERDYVVNVQPPSLRLQRSSMGSAASDSGRPPRTSVNTNGPGLLSAAMLKAQEQASGGAPASCGSPSVHSSEWPTAASMMWEDIVEEDEAQQQLLNGSVLGAQGPAAHSGVCSIPSLPLSYELTGQTGSLMYMSPEVFKNQPYNEATDVFSLGVILYELMSRSLLLYTHTPANKPEDCLRYAGKVAAGFRPRQPKIIPDIIWAVIEACWEQEPADRPPATWVVQQLQQLLAQEQEAAAQRAGSGLMQRLRPSRTASSTAAAAAAAGGTEDSKAAAGGTQNATARARGSADGTAAAAPEPSCGCVMC